MSDVLLEPAILLFHGRGAISTLIRWQTRSRYSHAALHMPCGRIIESWQGAGVRITTPTNYTGVHAYRVRGMTRSQWDLAFQFALARHGRPYDYLGIARFLTRRKLHHNDKWFCSELVFAAIRHAGIDLLSRIEPWAVSPGMLSHSPLLEPIAHCAPPGSQEKKVEKTDLGG